MGFKFTEYQADCLEAHNDYRMRHAVPRLELDKGLCTLAQDWANYLRDCDCLKLSKSCEFGENLFFRASERKVYPNAFEPVQNWYNEGKNFDPTTKYPPKEIKHFAQVIWRSTKALGVAYALNEDSTKIFVVAYYYPPGNDMTKFCENVKPLRLNCRDVPSETCVV